MIVHWQHRSSSVVSLRYTWSRRKYCDHKHRWLPCYRWKGWKYSIYSFPGADPLVYFLRSFLERVHLDAVHMRSEQTVWQLIYAGVHVEKIRFIIYTVMGLMSGLCAVFLVSSSYGANTTTGNGFEMDALQWQYSEVSPPQVVKVTWPAVSFLHSSSYAYELALDRRT